MNLLPDREQAELVSTARAMLAELFPLVDRPSTPDESAWNTLLTTDLLTAGADDDEDSPSLVEEVLVFREIGANVTPGPVLATTLAAHLAAELGREISSDVRFGLAVPVDPSDADRGFRVFGTRSCDEVVVLTPTMSWFEDLANVNGLRDDVSLDLDLDVGISLIPPPGKLDLTSPGAKLWWRGLLLIAAQLSGIASETLAHALKQATIREAFGRALGSNQAVKQQCADMAIRSEAASATVNSAAISASYDGCVASQRLIASAVFVSIDAARRNASSNIHLHGAIGYTWEHSAHVFLARAEVLAGSVGGDAFLTDAILGEVPAP